MGAKIDQTSIQNGVQDEMHLGIDFLATWVDLGTMGLKQISPSDGAWASALSDAVLKRGSPGIFHVRAGNFHFRAQPSRFRA